MNRSTFGLEVDSNMKDNNNNVLLSCACGLSVSARMNVARSPESCFRRSKFARRSGAWRNSARWLGGNGCRHRPC